jgi:osmotically-inducible protein OsmY
MTSHAAAPGRRITRLLTVPGICLGLVMAGAACGNTMQGVKQDTASVAEKVAGAADTAGVKSALIADERIDTSNINVDTNTDTNTVVLKGSVPTAQQKQLAEQIARDKAKGYRIVNQLAVTPTSS